MPRTTPQTINILGVGVHRLSMDGLIREAAQRARSGTRHTILYANVHVLNTAWGDPELRAILDGADVVYCDGAGVVLGARLLGHRLPGRMTGADWIEPLCARCAAEGLSLYLLGGRPGVAERAAHELIARHPGLRVAGTHHGYLYPPPPLPTLALSEAEGLGEGEGGQGGGGEGTAAAIAAVNAARPDLLLVGMGTPLQEKWIAAHRAELDVPVVWAVGALFDFVAGVQPRGPRWMLDHGLEWLYRLLSDPRRLWRRYLVGNPLFVLRVLWQRIAG